MKQAKEWVLEYHEPKARELIFSNLSASFDREFWEITIASTNHLPNVVMNLCAWLNAFAAQYAHSKYV